jgi:hypothetical protein
MKQYRRKNGKKIRGQVSKWKAANRNEYNEAARKRYHSPKRKAKHKARVESSYRSWLSHLLAKAKDTHIDVDYLCDIWNQQEGRCAFSGILMTHQFEDLRSISIDRIKKDRGFARGNIQLICNGFSWAKKKYGDKAVLSFIETVANNFVAI